VLAQGTNGIEAVELIRTHKPDVVFLDVQMPGLDGFAVLKKLLDKKMPLPQVVFATAFDQYAVRAFEVNAVDYLLKPFDRARVLKTLEKVRREAGGGGAASGGATPSWMRCCGWWRRAQPARAEGRQGDCARAEPAAAGGPAGDLLRVDRGGAISVTTRTVEGQSNCRTLEELMDQLDPEAFWRAHRSFVVNIQHIREVVPWFKSSYQLRMDDPKKTEIPVSRAQTKRLRELFNLTAGGMDSDMSGSILTEGSSTILFIWA
jgi:two-component system response regulator LytT